MNTTCKRQACLKVAGRIDRRFQRRSGPSCKKPRIALNHEMHVLSKKSEGLAQASVVSGCGHASFKSKSRFSWFLAKRHISNCSNSWCSSRKFRPPSERERGGGNPKASQDDAGEGEVRHFKPVARIRWRVRPNSS